MVAADAIVEADTTEGEAAATKAAVACWVMSDTSATVTSTAVGMTLKAVLARVAERVVCTDACKFPGELKARFLELSGVKGAFHCVLLIIVGSA